MTMSCKHRVHMWHFQTPQNFTSSLETSQILSKLPHFYLQELKKLRQSSKQTMKSPNPPPPQDPQPVPKVHFPGFPEEKEAHWEAVRTPCALPPVCRPRPALPPLTLPDRPLSCSSHLPAALRRRLGALRPLAVRARASAGGRKQLREFVFSCEEVLLFVHQAHVTRIQRLCCALHPLGGKQH